MWPNDTGRDVAVLGRFRGESDMLGYVMPRPTPTRLTQRCLYRNWPASIGTDVGGQAHFDPDLGKTRHSGASIG
jgi:hypothetical protein